MLIRHMMLVLVSLDITKKLNNLKLNATVLCILTQVVASQ